MNKYYVYIYLDPRKLGQWKFRDWVFPFRPFYVGYGQNNRMLDHFKPCSRKETNVKNKILNKLIDDGYTPVFFKIYIDLTKEQAKEIEIEVISTFGRIDLSTGILGNMTNGGDDGIFLTSPSKERREPKQRLGEHHNSKFTVQYDLSGNRIKKWGSLHALVKETNFNRAIIAECCNGIRPLAYGFVWKFEGNGFIPQPKKEPQGKKVYQYSLNGKFIKSFLSASEAARAMNIKNVAIIRVCNNQRKSSASYFWSYEYLGDEISPIITKGELSTKGKPIGQYDEKGDLIEKFSSVYDVYVKTTFHVKKAIDGGYLSRGYYWRFLPQDTLIQ